jgi:hypothetical protein
VRPKKKRPIIKQSSLQGNPGADLDVSDLDLSSVLGGDVISNPLPAALSPEKLWAQLATQRQALQGNSWRSLFEEAAVGAERLLSEGRNGTKAVTHAEKVSGYLLEELMSAIPVRLLKSPLHSEIGREVEQARESLRREEWTEADAAWLSAWRCDLGVRLREAKVPDSWKKPLPETRLSEAEAHIRARDIAQAKTSLQQAEQLVAYLHTNQTTISRSEARIIDVPDDAGNPLRIDARTAFAANGDTANATEHLNDAETATNTWKAAIAEGVFELFCTNTGQNLSAQAGDDTLIKWGSILGVAALVGLLAGVFVGHYFGVSAGIAMGLLASLVIGWIIWGIWLWWGTPNLDVETSVDDLFRIKARVAANQTAVPANYRFDWYLQGQNGSRVVHAPEPGKLGDELVETFAAPGWKRVWVEIRHAKVPSRSTKLNGYVEVKNSRFSVVRRFLEINTFAETALVVALASLLGFSAKYFVTGGVGTFGSFADYLGAFLCGATAKYGEESIKSLSNLASRVTAPAARPAPPAEKPAEEKK